MEPWKVMDVRNGGVEGSKWSRGESIDQWLQIRVSLIRSRIQIRILIWIKVKKRIWIKMRKRIRIRI
jgi:hypothetical protein